MTNQYTQRKKSAQYLASKQLLGITIAKSQVKNGAVPELNAWDPMTWTDEGSSKAIDISSIPWPSRLRPQRFLWANHFVESSPSVTLQLLRVSHTFSSHFSILTCREDVSESRTFASNSFSCILIKLDLRRISVFCNESCSFLLGSSTFVGFLIFIVEFIKLSIRR